MKTHIRFIITTFFKSLFFVISILISLVFILNLLTELDFFKETEVGIYFLVFVSLLNSPSLLFEILPFIFLITAQLFFIKMFNNNEINIFKYSGLKNSRILYILGLISFITGIFLSTIFYNLSSNLKNLYLEIKTNYTSDGKYLAVITNNGLWIKDEVDKKTLIINAAKIEDNFLINAFITQFDEDFLIIKNIASDRINIKKKNWIIYDARIIGDEIYETSQRLEFKTNFDLKRIQTLYSNLSSLDFYQLYKLRENYIRLNYSVTDINLQILKIITYPILLFLITIFSSIIMLRFKEFEGNTFKITLGLFFSVIIYYLINFSYVLGSTEKLNVSISVMIPLLSLATINLLMLYKINEK